MRLVIIENGEAQAEDASVEDHSELAARAAALCGVPFLQGLPIQKGELTPERRERARRLAERFNQLRP